MSRWGPFVKVPWSIFDEPWTDDPRAVGKYVRDLIAKDKERRKRQRYNIPAPVWQGILAAFGYRCAYCGADDLRLEREHRVPRAKGGSDDESNIVPACGPCNRRKGTDDPLNWPLATMP